MKIPAITSTYSACRCNNQSTKNYSNINFTNQYDEVQLSKCLIDDHVAAKATVKDIDELVFNMCNLGKKAYKRGKKYLFLGRKNNFEGYTEIPGWQGHKIIFEKSQTQDKEPVAISVLNINQGFKLKESFSIPDGLEKSWTYKYIDDEDENKTIIHQYSDKVIEFILDGSKSAYSTVAKCLVAPNEYIYKEGNSDKDGNLTEITTIVYFNKKDKKASYLITKDENIDAYRIYRLNKHRKWVNTHVVDKKSNELWLS